MRVEGKSDIYLVQDADPAAGEGHDLHRDQADEALVDAVRGHLLEREAAQVAAPRGKTAGGVLGHTLRGESSNEIRVVEVRHPHVAHLGVVRAGHDGEEVVVFGDALDAIARELEGSQLQLALQDSGRSDVRPGLSGVFQVGNVVRARLVEVHKGAQKLREGSRDGDIVARRARRDRGLLHVEARKAENQRSVGQ